MDKKTIEIQQLVAVKSSNISTVGYNDGAAFVQFSNGNIYKYNDVPIEQFHELAKAESVGKCFAKTLRSHKDYEQLKDVELVKVKLTEDQIVSGIIARLVNFSENDMHNSNAGVHFTVAKRILELIKENT